MSKPTAKNQRQEWFNKPDPTGETNTGETGLRFTCTQCGNCCTGPTGFVLFTDDEAQAMADELGVSKEVFYENYSRETLVGRSLSEIVTEGFGYDCVFLTRDEQGKTGCRIYSTRPEQCRTWPFWKSNLVSKKAWKEESQSCKGMNNGHLHTTEHIRITRERVEI